MVSGDGTTVIFLEGLPTLSNVYEKVKIFETTESRKPKGNTGRQPIWSKKFLLLYEYPR